MSRRVIVGCIAALMTIQTGLLVYSAKVHSPTWDEVGHLAAGLSHWELGRFELYSVNPPLVRTVAAAPVHFFCNPKMEWDFYRSDPSLRSEVFIGRQMIKLNGEDSFRYFFIARLAVIPISLLGGVLCFLWARDLFGDISGLIALTIWTFSPAVLAYGAVITPDLGSAVALMGTSYVFWRWLYQPTLSLAVALCFALALSMLTKSVWLALVPTFVAIWVIVSIVRSKYEPSEEPAPSLGRRLVSWFQGPKRIQAIQLGLGCAFSLLLVNGFYGFTGSFRSLGSYTFVSSSFSGNEPIKKSTRPDCVDCEQAESFSVEKGNRFDEGLLSALPVPIPANYLQGIDVQLRDFERGTYDPNWQSFLNGQWKQGGWWYYYIVGLFVKVPIATWLLIGAGSIAALSWKPDVRQQTGLVCLWLPAFLFFVVISTSTGLNRYVRYALPVLPVLFVWGSQLGRLADLGAKRSPSIRRLGWGVSIALCGWLAVVSVRSAPHHLSYFNEVAGGSESGHVMLCDSNVDWGQDLILLQSWLAENPDAAESLHLAYFGAFDPKSVGIDYRPPPVSGIRRTRNLAVEAFVSGDQPLPLRAGWYVLSKNYVVGHTMPLPDGFNHLQFQFVEPDAFARFRELKPVDRIGHSMLVYHIPDPVSNQANALASSP